jgi:hypothetical protein
LLAARGIQSLAARGFGFLLRSLGIIVALCGAA